MSSAIDEPAPGDTRLHAACRACDAKLLEQLLAESGPKALDGSAVDVAVTVGVAGTDGTLPTPMGPTHEDVRAPVHVDVHVNVVVNARNADGHTALTLALQAGDCCRACAQVLIGSGAADVNQCGPAKRTPLIIACEKGDLDLVCLLLDRGADVDTRFKKNEDSPYWGNNTISAITIVQDQVSCYGTDQTLLKLISHSKRLDDHIDSTYGTPLINACQKRRREVALAIAMSGKGVDFSYHPSYKRSTPLLSACEQGWDDVALAILDRIERASPDDDHASVASTTNTSAIISPSSTITSDSKRSSSRVKREMLKLCGSDLSYRTTPLDYAIEKRLTRVLDRARDVFGDQASYEAANNVADYTELMVACHTRQENVALALLRDEDKRQGSSQLEYVSRKGETALTLACKQNLECVALTILSKIVPLPSASSTNSTRSLPHTSDGRCRLGDHLDSKCTVTFIDHALAHGMTRVLNHIDTACRQRTETYLADRSKYAPQIVALLDGQSPD